ncbi:cardiolipin synthase [Maridesulfovibrio ferrireducens]|uniref:Cardiolipin synthase n=1 Tax=Maridesulfovibrio ferrireducens TaxID=246191 RepID=A0A1G9JM54_9BACT|nr:cardiolipin synthase [Maridesulfovibrio ferrireducens]SDL38386.1 cardiolipin synthase [Maridesulfovibrio ferrireducens]
MTLELLAFIALFFHFLGFFSAIKAIMESRTPQGSVAWALGLVAIPYLALPAYWIFGRNKFHGFVKLLRANHARSSDAVQEYTQVLRERNLLMFPDQRIALPIEKIAKLPFTSGNNVDLLIDGRQTFDSIFAGIARAEKYILVQFYIVKADGLGNELKDRLISKAREGVEVCFLYDEIGSLGLADEYLSGLSAAGVKVYAFNTTKGRANRFQLNFRNHRKIVVVDGVEAWVGGHNVGDEYLGQSAGLRHWRDTHIRIAGPAAQSIQVSFYEDWYWASNELLELEWNPVAAEGGRNVGALALPSGPEDTFEACTLFFMECIQSARERLWIVSPYFVPDEQFITALHLAVLRGVDVRIMIPRKTDNFLVTYTHWAYVDQLLQIGAKVYWYDKGFLHQKVVLVDEGYATVGTANFDNRSFRLNFEITMVIANEDFNSEVASMLENDFSNSVQVTDEDIIKKSFLFHLFVRVAQLTAPIQ